MILRVTQAQFNLFKRQLARAADPAGAPDEPRRRRRREDLPENQIEARIVSYLAYRGFFNTRMHIGTFIPYRVLKQIHAGHLAPEQAERNIVRVNEKGAPDWWSARPIVEPGARPLDKPWPWQGFWWECKRPGVRPTEAQLAWLNRHQQLGLTAWWFNEFQASDRPSPPCQPHLSNVFVTWFEEYFAKEDQ
jgi:hypothetical protein